MFLFLENCFSLLKAKLELFYPGKNRQDSFSYEGIDRLAPLGYVNIEELAPLGRDFNGNENFFDDDIDFDTYEMPEMLSDAPQNTTDYDEIFDSHTDGNDHLNMTEEDIGMSGVCDSMEVDFSSNDFDTLPTIVDTTMIDMTGELI